MIHNFSTFAFLKYFDTYQYLIFLSSFIFDSHKVYCRMQGQMMLRLNCTSWEDVQKDYPKSSSQDALKFHFLAFKNIVSSKLNFLLIFLFCEVYVIFVYFFLIIFIFLFCRKQRPIQKVLHIHVQLHSLDIWMLPGKKKKEKRTWIL